MHDPQRGDDRLLVCVKANYGRTGWGARLCESRGSGGVFLGFNFVARMSRDDQAKRKPPDAKTDGRGSRIGGKAAGTRPTSYGDVSPDDVTNG